MAFASVARAPFTSGALCPTTSTFAHVEQQGDSASSTLEPLWPWGSLGTFPRVLCSAPCAPRRSPRSPSLGDCASQAPLLHAGASRRTSALYSLAFSRRLRFSSAFAPRWSLAPHLGGTMHARPMQRGLAAHCVLARCTMLHKLLFMSFPPHLFRERNNLPGYQQAALSHVNAWYVTTTRNTPSRRDACTCLARVSSAQVSVSSSSSFTLPLEGNCS